MFTTGSNGSGRHFGVHSSSSADNDSAATGVYGFASNTGLGRAIGGEFTTGAEGSGRHFGVLSQVYGNSDSTTFGVFSTAENMSSGANYGGYFEAKDYGTGMHLGLYTKASASSSNAYGLYSYAEGDRATKGLYSYAYAHGDNGAWGGQFVCDGYGTGEAWGVESYVLGGTSISTMYGVEARAAGGQYFAGTGYGGYFNSVGLTNASTQYGVYALAENYSNIAAYGVYGRGEQSGSGTSYGGYFLTDSNGTGTSYGIRPVGLSKGSATAFGTASVAANRSTGVVYGGYFEMLNYGTGGGYGIYAKARTTGAPASWAGYFEGHVRVTGTLSVLGTKSAAVKVDNGEYRLLYCQESPENWFEDFGEGQLMNGRAHIEMDPMFLQTVSIDRDNPMKVFVQLNDPDCNGTAVVRGQTGFDVVELMNGTGDASFSYRVVAKRRGFENARLGLMPSPTPEESAAQAAATSAALQADEQSVEVDRLKRQAAQAQRAAEEPILR
jgi:hypothetical protein